MMEVLKVLNLTFGQLFLACPCRI